MVIKERLIAVLVAGTIFGLNSLSIQAKRFDMVVGEVRTMNMAVNRDDLEEIRRVAIGYYESKKPEFWSSFVQELRRGAIFLERSGPAIGIWKYQVTDGRPALIREPPISSQMHYFGLNLSKQDNKWTVIGDFHEREKLDLRE
jgi:hypothetical protein